MTNQERAAEVLRDDKHYKMGPHGEQFLTSEAARSLANAGLLMPDLPEVENSGSMVGGGGIGARFPKTAHSIPHVVIFGNPQITPHIQAASCDDNLVAIRADQLDHMIATLMTARNLMHKKENK